MANIRSSAKRARQSEVRTTRNRSVLTNLKSQLKKSAAAVAVTSESAVESAKKLVSSLDKAAKTGRIHRNKANRHKRQLAKRRATAAAKS